MPRPASAGAVPAQHRPLLPAPARRARRAHPGDRRGRRGRARPSGPGAGRRARRTFDHRVTFEKDGEAETVACRWVLDATGRANFLGKRLGLIERNREHPTAAVWCRWEGVRHIDDVAARGPLSFSRGNVGSRRLATNHYMGFGYWVWFIPLGNGETSIGVVFDTAARPTGPGQGSGERLPGVPRRRSPWRPSCSRAPA